MLRAFKTTKPHSGRYPCSQAYEAPATPKTEAVHKEKTKKEEGSLLISPPIISGKGLMYICYFEIPVKNKAPIKSCHSKEKRRLFSLTTLFVCHEEGEKEGIL